MPHATRADAIAAGLRKAIIEQALEPGAKLPEDLVGDAFGVSRTIGRRALELLAAEELVEFRPNRGAVVVRPTLEEGQDLFATRIEIERVVVRRLTGALDEEKVATLRRMVEEEHRALRDGRPEYVRLAAEFHILLGEMTGSPTLSRFLRQLVWRSAIVLRLYGKPRWDSCNIEEHLDLIQALTGRDPARSERLMADHLDSVLVRALAATQDTRPAEVGLVLARYALD